MPVRVAHTHRTSYAYDRPVALGPRLVRSRPAPHTRTRIVSDSLRVQPVTHAIRWQQDPQGYFVARLTFDGLTEHFGCEVDLVAELEPVNPFDFFLGLLGYAEVEFSHDMRVDRLRRRRA